VDGDRICRLTLYEPAAAVAAAAAASGMAA
jgi:hypothetical protein